MLKTKKIIFLVLVFLALAFCMGFSDIALADTDVDLGGEYVEDIGLSSEDPRVIAGNIIQIFLSFLALIAVILLIYAGYLWMTAEGNEEKVEKAKNTIKGAVIGLIIIVSSFVIVSFVLNEIGGAMNGGGGSGGGGGGNVTPSPSPGVEYCDSNTITAVCDADHGLCEGDEYCEVNSCTCQPKEGVGGSCDADDTDDICEPVDHICLSGDCDDNCICTSSPEISDISPAGGFCEDDVDTPCRYDDDCASGRCDDNTPNGKSGNFITISGDDFGDDEGSVYFESSNGETRAEFPGEVNPECGDTWTDNNVVVVIPSGIGATSSVKLERADGKTDTTDNDIGDKVPDLVSNGITRPGLCRIDPAKGQIGDTLDYYGINLRDSKAYFGHYASYVEAYDPLLETNTEGEAEVPSINTGTTTSFASTSAIYSNYLEFVKDKEPYSGPYISYFSPTEGAPGQYVTIHGDGFGSSRSVNNVYFGDPYNGGVKADYDFPSVCSESYWRDSEIIVKVPEGIGNGDYGIYIDLGGDVINTGKISPSEFEVDSSLSLLPSLCKMEPVMGPYGVDVDFWGEYFGNSTGTVRFNLRKDQTGDAIDRWGEDGDADKAETTVPEGASTGAVKLSRSGSDEFGNSMNFEVGLCTEAEDEDEACGNWICCGEGTYKEGRCAEDEDDCSADIPASVYEWEFDTGIGTTTSTTTYESCRVKSREEGGCANACPNSPGECSFDGDGVDSITSLCSDQYCADLADCVDSNYDNCEYYSDIDRCVGVDPGFVACDLGFEMEDIIGETVIVKCNSDGYRYYETSLSCVDGYSKDVYGNCVDHDSFCAGCDNAFECADDNDSDNEGVCAIPNEVCGEGAVCDDGECAYSSSPFCDCCCRVGSGEEDCCSFVDAGGVTRSLECDWMCGDDTNKDDDSGYGLCSGCRIDSDGDGSIDADEQALSDEACVCEGTTGKYCDVSVDVDDDGEPDGVCRDCTTLEASGLCSDHNATCCVDGENDDICRGGYGDMSLGGGVLGYCQYYTCTEDGSGSACDTGNPIATSTDNIYSSTSTCANKCAENNDGLGAGKSCYSLDNSACTLICANPYNCRDSAGDEGAGAEDDCLCCCDPSSDLCSEFMVGGDKMSCSPDQDPCTGGNRGLCCGCESDNDCADIVSNSADDTGCGFDSCCHPRPTVEGTVPANGEIDVCSNIKITAEFDTQMDAGSFGESILVLGEYSGVCPEGTDYISLGEAERKERGIFAFFKDMFVSFKQEIARLMGSEAVADTPSDNMNYCAVGGSVNADHRGEDKTILEFELKELLDTNRKYFVIIKGDENLDSVSGVKSFYGVGMNGEYDEKFNGLEYDNSHIWSFTTMEDQGANGVCEVDSVAINPESYMFTTHSDDHNEDDANPGSGTFDTVSSGGYDRDKVFEAEALNSEGEAISSINGVYSWSWSWSVVDDTIVDISSEPGFSSSESRQLIEAQETATNDHTEVEAEADITSSISDYPDDTKTALSSVWVFLCDNPWPDFTGDNWYPWSDDDGNCDDGNTCHNMNYEMYYCRDEGSSDITSDDLPALYQDEVTKGESDEAYKESYFFHELPPNISVYGLSVAGVDTGEVNLGWSAADDFEYYKVYYGKSSGSYYDYVEANIESVTITGLTDGDTYYFAVSAVSAGDAESDLSEEVSATPRDDDPPVAPNIKGVYGGDGFIDIAWSDESSADADGFEAVYKASESECNIDLNFGASEDISYASEATTTITGLANGVRYCVGIVAIDEYGNRATATYSTVITPFADVSGLSASAISGSDVDLNWGYSDDAGAGAGQVEVYYREEGESAFSSEVVSFATATVISGLNEDSLYYFQARSLSETGSQEGEFTSLISARTSDAVAPANPSIIRVLPLDGALKVSFDHSGGEYTDEYDIYITATSGDCVNMDGDDPYMTVGGDEMDVTFADPRATVTVDSLANGKEYCTAILARDASGNESSVITDPGNMPFAGVDSVSSSVTSDSINLSWTYTEDGAPGVDHLNIDYGAGTQNNISASASSSVITGLNANTEYDIRFYTVNPYSAEEDVKIGKDNHGELDPLNLILN